MRLDGNGLAIDPNAGSRCCQQLSNAHFRFFVIAFAEVMIAHAPCRIDEVERRPIVMTEPTPDRAVVVDGNGIRDASLLCGPSHVVDVFLKREFWCVHADDDQPVFFVPRGPGADVRQCAKPVMQVYVQKSTRTTLPGRSAAVGGSELSQAVAPPSEAGRWRWKVGTVSP